MLQRSYVDLPCPICSYIMSVQIRSVCLEESMFCPCCKVRVDLIDENGGMQRACDNLSSSLEGLNQTLTLEL